MKTDPTTVKAELEEDPPGSHVSQVTREADEEPPSRQIITNNRRRLFSHVSDSDWNDWRWHFRNRITSVEELAKYIPLSSKEKTQIKLVMTKYPFAVTPYYLSLIDIEDPQDPVRKQAIPCFQEIAMADMGSEDPLEEKRDSVVPGLVHRYPDRVLMVLTDICSMLCRHCTRKREWHNGGWIRSKAEIEPMMDYIRRNKQVRDVIISGGDPLTLNTSYLEDILKELRSIEHVEIIRIGTRFPVVLPQRIDAELCNMLSKYGPIWLNTHFNHPKELTPEAVHACDMLLRAGVPVSNQAVLMRGINDTVETQMKLNHGLLKAKVRPYYLFQCDEVQGTEHLHTPLGTGMKIMEQMRGRTSGLAIPSFVVDLPGGGGKIPIMPNYILSQSEDEFMLRNYEGRVFHFRNPMAPEPSKPNRRNGNRETNPQLAFPKMVPLLKGETIN
jgi:lysine 2,3-aminomutase